jgi:3-oxoacyl-[acyl-carrier-protein] synthase-3
MNADELASHLLHRLHEVQTRLHLAPAGDIAARFADVIDSMGMVEFIGQLADDCSVEPEVIERAAGRRFSTVGALAQALRAANVLPRVASSAAHKPDAPARDVLTPPPSPLPEAERGSHKPDAPAREAATVPSLARRACESPVAEACVASVAVRLPGVRQLAEEVDDLLGRPKGWFLSHSGIEARCLWGMEDALDAAAQAGRECLNAAGTAREDVSVLLATGEAPPVAVGLAQALHARLGLPPACLALEVGGACTGLVAALWLGQRLLTAGGAVLVVAVEAPSRWLAIQPGAAGETAALFTDGAGACMLKARPMAGSRRIRDVMLAGDGTAGHLFQALPAAGGVRLHMEGPALASRAVRLVAATVRDLVERNNISFSELEALVVHGGNGRLPGLLARRLGLPDERIRSETGRTGNLGSVSLPAAWAAGPSGSGPVVWAAIGAGLTWGAVLLDPPALA